jgi:hypothetical protein
VWRVLKGPNNDWPLAVCDFSSINIDEETTTNDALHLTRTGENWLLYPSDTHQWYYMSDMEPEDLIIFRNADSKGELSRKSFLFAVEGAHTYAGKAAFMLHSTIHSQQVIPEKLLR